MYLKKKKKIKKRGKDTQRRVQEILQFFWSWHQQLRGTVWLWSSETDGHTVLSAFQSNSEQLGTPPAECSKSVSALLKAFSLLLLTPVGLYISPPLLGCPQLAWGLKWGLWVNVKLEHVRGHKRVSSPRRISQKHKFCGGFSKGRRSMHYSLKTHITLILNFMFKKIKS